MNDSSLKNSLELANDTLQLTSDIMKESFVRLTGTPQTKKAAEYLLHEYENVADNSKIEEFDVYPLSFLSFLKVLVVVYFMGLVFLSLAWGYRYFGLILLCFVMVFGLSQFMFYFDYFDKLHPKKRGYNAYGVIEPENPENVEQQIIVCGHVDSPFIFNYLEKHPMFYAIHIILALLPAFMMLCYYIYLVISKNGSSITSMTIFFIIASGFVMRFWFFKDSLGSPGAGDNLISCSITVTLGKLFGKTSKNRLKKTRLILLSVDAEECGLRGALDYARRHKEECTKIPTKVIVIDGIFRFSEIKIFTSDINGFVKLSLPLSEEIANTCMKFGIKPKLFPIPLLGGGTDAGSFAREGYEATSIVACQTKALRNVTDYHTSRDVVEHIQPEAVEAILKILYDFILDE